MTAVSIQKELENSGCQAHDVDAMGQHTLCLASIRRMQIPDNQMRENACVNKKVKCAQLPKLRSIGQAETQNILGLALLQDLFSVQD